MEQSMKNKGVIPIPIHDAQTCFFPAYSEQPPSVQSLFTYKITSLIQGKNFKLRVKKNLEKIDFVMDVAEEIVSQLNDDSHVDHHKEKNENDYNLELRMFLR